MEVWLESLALHLAVGAAIPSDLLLDIYTYSGTFFYISSIFRSKMLFLSGRSSSSSESNTPTEGLTPEIRISAPIIGQPISPLRTICEATNDLSLESPPASPGPIYCVIDATNL